MTPPSAPAETMDAVFLGILNKWMDHFLKQQNYTLRPEWTFYIPKNMMDRFVQEIGREANQEGGKLGYNYPASLVRDAFERRGYMQAQYPATKNPDRRVTASPYDQPGSAVPVPGSGTPAPTPPPRPPTPPPPAPTPTPTPGAKPPDDRTYSERVRDRIRDRKQQEKEKAAAGPRVKKETKRQKRIREEGPRVQRELKPPTAAEWAIYYRILTMAMTNRLEAAGWETKPSGLTPVQPAQLDKMAASIQTFANMMIGYVYRFNSSEVDALLLEAGYAPGPTTAAALPMPAELQSFGQYKTLYRKIKELIEAGEGIRFDPSPKRDPSRTDFYYQILHKWIHYFVRMANMQLPKEFVTYRQKAWLEKLARDALMMSNQEGLRYGYKFDIDIVTQEISNKGFRDIAEKQDIPAKSLSSNFIIMTPLTRPTLPLKAYPWLKDDKRIIRLEYETTQVLARSRLDAMPSREYLIDTATHAALVQKIKAKINSKWEKYGEKKFDFTNGDVRDTLIRRGYLAHPLGTSKPTQYHITSRENDRLMEGREILPWEVPGYFPNLFPPPGQPPVYKPALPQPMHGLSGMDWTPGDRIVITRL